MLKDRKSTKIILLMIVIVLMFVPGFRIFHMRGGLMRDKNLDCIDLHYENIGMLHAEAVSGDIEIIYDETMDGIHIEAEHGSSNIGGSNNNLTIKTVSDDIRITFGPESIDEIRASSVSGEITARGTTLDTLDLSTTSGSIDVNGGKIESALSLSSTSGSMDIYGIDTENLYASVKSGSLEINSIDADNMTLTTISGGIDVMDSKSEDVRITSTSGSTKLMAMDEYVIEYSTTTGKITAGGKTLKGNGIFGTDLSPMKINFRSTSGNLEII